MRYLDIGIQPRAREIKQKLTVVNPNYVYQKDRLGIRTERITVPKDVKVYQEAEDGRLLIPRGSLGDPDILESVDIWCNLEPLPIKKAKYPTWKEGKTLRPYQVEPCKALLSNKSDILIAECGFGKTTCGVNIIAHTETPVCVVVHLDFLANQWFDELQEFTDARSVVIHKNDSIQRSLEANIVIIKIQSLLRLKYEDNHELYDRFNLVIFDEVHALGTLEFGKIIANFPCKRIGLTATPERTDGFRIYKWHIGSRELIARGNKKIETTVIGFDPGVGKHINNSMITMNTRKGEVINIARLINHVYAIDTNNRNQKYIDTSSPLYERTRRTIELVRELVGIGRHILLLSHRRLHAEHMYESLSDISDRELLLGGITPNGEHRQLVIATFQYVRVAFNRPRLDTLINTGPYTATNDVKQASGRIRRIVENKPTPLVIEIYDKRGVSENMFKKRLIAYKHLTYNIARTDCRTVEQVLDQVRNLNKI